jgi:hypothetical protein
LGGITHVHDSTDPARGIVDRCYYKQCAEPANERFQDRQVLTKAEETVLEEKKFRRTIGVLDVYLFI